MNKLKSRVAVGLAGLLMSVSAAQAQNILILTTGSKNTRPDAENNHMRYTVEEFAAPLTFANFTAGGQPCNSTQSVVVGGLTKSVTCNQTELVNGTAMSASIFDPGYDLLVVASAYTDIDAADWAVIEEAISSRRVRGAVFFVDTINAPNTVAMEGVLSAAMGATVTRGSQAASGNYYYPLNTNAAGQSSFTGLPTLQLNTGFYVYSGVPSQYALYTGDAGAATDPTVAVPLGTTTTASSIFVPQTDSFAGAGACVFGVTDIGWGLSGTGHNIGRLGNAFLAAFNDPAGVCATPLASPPEIGVTKSTTTATQSIPANGATVPYTVEVRNVSPTALALNVGLSDPQPAGMAFGQWSCTQIAPLPDTGLCPTGMPVGGLNTTIASLPAGAVLRFTVEGTVTDNTASLTNVATVSLPAGATCEGGAVPCASQVAFSAAPTAVPVLGFWGLLWTGLGLAGLAWRFQIRRP